MLMIRHDDGMREDTDVYLSDDAQFMRYETLMCVVLFSMMLRKQRTLHYSPPRIEQIRVVVVELKQVLPTDGWRLYYDC